MRLFYLQESREILTINTNCPQFIHCFQSQKRNKMLNSFMQIMYTKIHESLDDKTTDFIKKKAQSLGIENKQYYHKQRLMFLISQYIAYHIDLHVQESKRSIKGLKSCNINSILKKRNQMLDQNNNRNHSIHFVKATFLHHYICGPSDIFKSVRLIEELQTELLSQYEIQEITLQAFKENQQIQQIFNQRQFACICKYQVDQQSARCEKCMKKFHPLCQYQKLVCNRCFLSHYFYPIEPTFFSKFGQKRKTSTYFHGKFRCYNVGDQRKSQLFAIKFDIDDFQNLQNANQPQFIIKIINFKTLGSDEQKSQKWKNLNQKFNDSSIFLNFNRFEFFLNFFQLRRKHLYFRDENSLIFKLENRMPKYKDNILMIKCDPHFFQDQTYEIGIYRISKIKNNIKQRNTDRQIEINNGLINDQHSKQIRITSDQYRLLQKYSKLNYLNQPKQNVKVEQYKIKMNEEDDDNNQKNQKSSNFQLVRSYSCNHKEGFDLAQLRKNHLKFMETSRQAHRNKDLKNQIEKLFQKQLFKQYKKHALRTNIINIKTQQDLPFNQQHFQSIRRYCIDNDLLKYVEIPELQNFQKNLVDNQIKKIIGRYQIKKSINKKIDKKNRKQANQKQQKKYRKFAKCPICRNFLSVLYLLPYQQRQGEQMKISKSYRTLKKKKVQLSQEEAKQSMLQMFRPKSIFRFNQNKKQEESENEDNQSEDDNEYEQQNQQEEKIKQKIEKDRETPNILLEDSDHKQVFEQSLKSHKIYITRNRQPSGRFFSQNLKEKQQQAQLKFQIGNEKLQEIDSEQLVYNDEQVLNRNIIRESVNQFKVMSEQSSQSSKSQINIIPQQNIIKVQDSQSLQQLSFDSPILNCQQINIKPIFKSKKINCQNVKNQINDIEEKRQIIDEKRQIFSIPDLQSQNLQNYQINPIVQMKLSKDQIINYTQFPLEQKKQNQFNSTFPPKQIIQISLLSEDEEEQGQMKIYYPIRF